MHSDFEKCAVVCYFSDSNEPSTQDVNLSIPAGKGKDEHLSDPLQGSPNNSKEGHCTGMKQEPSDHSWVTTAAVRGMCLCSNANTNKLFILSLLILTSLSYNINKSQAHVLDLKDQ